MTYKIFNLEDLLKSQVNFDNCYQNLTSFGNPCGQGTSSYVHQDQIVQQLKMQEMREPVVFVNKQAYTYQQPMRLEDFKDPYVRNMDFDNRPFFVENSFGRKASMDEDDYDRFDNGLSNALDCMPTGVVRTFKRSAIDRAVDILNKGKDYPDDYYPHY